MSNQTLTEVLEGSRERFVVAQVNGMNFDSEMEFAIQIISKNDTLLKAAQHDRSSLLQALGNVAAIGLTLNTAAKEAYLVPRGGKVCLEPSYIGLCKLATVSGAIEWIQADFVCKNDGYIYNGPGEKPTIALDPSGDRGDIVGFYCVAKTTKGDYLTTNMSKAAVDEVKALSKSQAWVKFYTEQGKKVVIRRASKTWPKGDDNRMNQAVEISNLNEGFEPLVTAPEINQYNTEQKKFFDALITADDALGMYVFMEGVEESVHQSLNHSFKQGEKGKYQKITGKLIEEGRKTFYDDYFLSIKAAIDNVDDDSVLEMLVELGPSATTLMLAKLPTEYSQALTDIIEANKVDRDET